MKRNNIFKTIALIALCTISTAIFPTVARAEEEEPKAEGVHLNKTAEYNEVDKKGLITLSSFVEGEIRIITKATPIDVAILIDCSNSMKAADNAKLYEACCSFIDSLHASSIQGSGVNHRVSIITFGLQAVLWCNLTPVNTDENVAALKQIIYNKTYDSSGKPKDGAETSTMTANAMYMAKSVLQGEYVSEVKHSSKTNCFKMGFYSWINKQPFDSGNDNTRPELLAPQADGRAFCLLFTDGAATDTEADAIVCAKDIKKKKEDGGTIGGTIYSIGLFANVGTYESTKKKVAKYLQAISSNYPDATSSSDVPDTDISDRGYFSRVENRDGLKSVFEGISKEIKESTPAIELGTEAIIKDFINKSYFKLPDNTKPENIKVYKAPFTGFNDKKEFMFNDTTGRIPLSIADLKAASGIENPIQVLTDDKGYQYVSVQGFNFSENFCAMAGDTPRGYELLVEIPFEFIGTGQSGDLPTNTAESGIYTRDPITGEDTKVDPYPVPHIVFCTLNITRTNLLRGETAIYSVVSNKYNTEVCKVTLSAPEDGMILKESVVGLPEGSYTVTETNWNWAYDKSGEISKIVVVSEGMPNSAIFQGSHINGTGDEPAEMHNHDEAFKSNIMIIPKKTK